MTGMNLYEKLAGFTRRPEPFEFYTADALWTDEHISKKMLEYHLNDSVDLASRNHAFIESSSKWIVQRFKLGPGSAVCDCGCGPGLYTVRLAETGASVTGVDFSARSIEYARNAAGQAGLHIDYVLQNYLEFTTKKKFDLITMIFCDFCALSPNQRKTMLLKFREMLKDNGAVLIDVLTAPHFDTAEENTILEHYPEGGFWSEAPYFVLAGTFKYPETNLVLIKHTVAESDRTREIFNWLQCFTRESIETEFRENGLKIEEVFADVGGSPFTPDSVQMAVVARRL